MLMLADYAQNYARITCKSLLWDPFSQNDINRLELSLSKSKFALKLISHRCDAHYEELITLMNVPRLIKIRQDYKYIIVHKYIVLPGKRAIFF